VNWELDFQSFIFLVEFIFDGNYQNDQNETWITAILKLLKDSFHYILRWYFWNALRIIKKLGMNWDFYYNSMY
jgi:hypothetical protein